MSETIRGRCPMGCGETLFVGSGGYITCSWIKCPNPTAVADLLLSDAGEQRHIVDLGEDTFTVRHPLRERVEGTMHACGLHDWIAALGGPPRAPGRYYVTAGADGSWGSSRWAAR